MSFVRRVVSEREKAWKLKCGRCTESFRRYDQLREHLANHGLEIVGEEVDFATMEEFIQWKEAKEREMNCLYVLNAGAKTSTKNIRKKYYVCHRSGCFKSKSFGKRAIKRQGSCKIGAACPSTLQLLQTDAGIKATLWMPHDAHENSVEHLPLTKKERLKIAEQIAEGVPVTRILEEVKNENNKGESPSRLQLLSRQDLWNVKRDILQNQCFKISLSDRKKRLRRKIEWMMECVKEVEMDEPTCAALEKMLDDCIGLMMQRSKRDKMDPDDRTVEGMLDGAVEQRQRCDSAEEQEIFDDDVCILLPIESEEVIIGEAAQDEVPHVGVGFDHSYVKEVYIEIQA